MKVQSVLIPKSKFSKKEAYSFLKEHNFKHSKIHTTEQYYRFRQLEPNKSADYKVKTLPNGVKLILM